MEAEKSMDAQRPPEEFKKRLRVMRANTISSLEASVSPVGEDGGQKEEGPAHFKARRILVRTPSRARAKVMEPSPAPGEDDKGSWEEARDVPGLKRGSRGGGAEGGASERSTGGGPHGAGETDIIVNNSEIEELFGSPAVKEGDGGGAQKEGDGGGAQKQDGSSKEVSFETLFDTVTPGTDGPGGRDEVQATVSGSPGKADATGPPDRPDVDAVIEDAGADVPEMASHAEEDALEDMDAFMEGLFDGEDGALDVSGDGGSVDVPTEVGTEEEGGDWLDRWVEGDEGDDGTPAPEGVDSDGDVIEAETEGEELGVDSDAIEAETEGEELGVDSGGVEAETEGEELVGAGEDDSPGSGVQSGLEENISHRESLMEVDGLSALTGLTNGNGLTNGSGLTLADGPGDESRLAMGAGPGIGSGLKDGNGLTNGNGLTDGNGLTNGDGLGYAPDQMENESLTDGNGLSEGVGRSRRGESKGARQRARSRMLRRARREAFSVTLTFSLLIMVPCALYAIQPPADTDFCIDGDFADWTGTTLVSDPVGDTQNPNIDLVGLSAHRGEDLAHIRADFDGVAFSGSGQDRMDILHVFIDTDDVPTTGYSISGLGADMVVTLKGMDGEVVSASAMSWSVWDEGRYELRDNRDWNGFQDRAYTRAASDGGSVEVEIAGSVLSATGTVTAVSMDASGNLDDSDTPITMKNARWTLPPSGPETEYSQKITIDGWFGDWRDVPSHEDPADLHDSPDVDIRSYKMYQELSALSFFIEVDGTILEGSWLPYFGKEFLYPREDMTGGPGTGQPAGGFALPELSSDDAVRIYIDSDSDANTGHFVGGKGAEYLIVVKGYDSRVTGRQIYSWDDDWVPWSRSVAAAAIGPRMELQFPPLPGTRDGFDVVMITADWYGQRDVVDMAGWDMTSLELGPTGIPGYRAGEPPMTEVSSGVGSEGGDMFGWNVSYAGDVNGDGFGDIIVGAPYNDTADGSMADAGAAYIFFGYTGLDAGDINASTANVSIYGAAAGDLFGWDVGDLGDVGSDANDDIIIGAPGAEDAGRAYIYYGRGAWSATYTAAGADVTITGETDGDGFGRSVAGAGDFDGLNSRDIIVGAPLYDAGGEAWWDADWSYRMNLTFDNSDQTETLTNFPVLVNLSSANFDYSKANANASDLRFIDEDGTTELAYEIEQWDTGGYSLIWVNVTSITGLSPTDHIWMYFNNSLAGPGENADGVWNGKYSLVWHLNETASPSQDSTGNGNSGTWGAGKTSADAVHGKVGKGSDFDGITTDLISSTADLTAIKTISFWYNRDNTVGDWAALFEGEPVNDEPFLGFGDGGDINEIEIWYNGGQRWNSASKNLDTWYYFVFVSDGTNSRVYVDGTDESGALANYAGTPTSFKLGYVNDVAFDGIMDEFRISTNAESGDWIAAQHLSMTDDFITYNSEETQKTWWNEDWAYKKKLTFDNTGQSETLAHFPVLVNLSASNIDYAKTKAGGADLRFVDSDDQTVLTYHIEKWDTSGHSIVWVDVTGIDGSSGTDSIWMYYGNAGASDSQDEPGTFDEDYVGVWHLDETSGAHDDSTTYANDGTVQGGVVQDSDGVMDGADAFDGIAENVTAGNHSSLNLTDDITVEAWLNGSGVASSGDPIGTIGDSVIDSIEYDTLDGGNPEIIHISGDVFAVVRKGGGNPGILTTLEIAANGQITDSPIDSLTFDATKGDKPVIEHVYGNIYAIAYKDNDGDGWLKTVEIAANGAITDTVTDSFEFDTAAADQARMLKVADNVFAVVYKDASKAGIIKTIWIDNDGTINTTVLDTMTYDSNGENPDFIHVSDDVYAIAFKDANKFGHLKTVEIASDGDITDTPLDALVFDGVGGDKPKIAHVSGDIYAITYKDSAGDGQLVTVDIASDGTIANSVVDSYEFDTDAADNSDLVCIADGYFAVSYKDGDGDGQLFTIDIDSDGTIGGSKIDTLEFDTADGNEGELVHVSGDTYAIAYKGSDGDGFVKTFSIVSSIPATEVGVVKEDSYRIHSDSTTTYASINGNVISTSTSSGWKYVVMTYDKDAGSNQMNLYVDGSLATSGTLTAPIAVTDFDLLIGQNFTGRIDEVRVSKTVRSADWTAAQYLSMTDQFITFGDEEDHDHGRVYIFYGDGSIPTAAGNADVIKTGENSTDRFGLSVSTAGDTDNDGVDDVIVGAPYNDGGGADAGAAYVYFGGSGSLKLMGASAGDLLGWSVGNASDINQDGSYDDVLVGAPGYSGSTGRAYIYHGGASMDAAADVTLTGETAGDMFGYSVGGGRHVDNDASPDIVVGAPYYDNGTTADAGIVYWYKGGSSMDTAADWVNKGTQASQHLGWSVSLGDDIDGGPCNESIAGSPHKDDANPEPDNEDAGQATVFSIVPEFSFELMAVLATTGILFAFTLGRRGRVKRGKSTQKDTDQARK